MSSLLPFFGIKKKDNSGGVTGGTSTDSDVQTYLNSLTAPMDLTQITRLETLAAALRSAVGLAANAPLSGKFDFMYILANETEEAALHNFIKRSHDAITVGTITFAQYRGYTGDTITGYINSNYKPSTDAVAVTLGDHAYGTYVRTLASTGHDWVDFGGQGAAEAGRTRYIVKWSNNNYYFNGHGTADIGYTWYNYFGHLMGNREVSTGTTTLYGNGSAFNSGQRTPTELTPVNLYLGAMNNNGTAESFSGRQYALFYSAGKITVNQFTAINTAINTYMAAVGANV